jgi:hypothetical protein
MSERTLSRLLGVLGVLVVVWLISSQLSGGGGAGGVSDGGVASLLEGLNETTVRAVRIAHPNRTASLEPGALETVTPETAQRETVMLEANGGAWTVNGHAADSLSVTRLWSALDGAVVGGVVVNNPRNHERMGVSADSAWVVDFTLTDGGIVSLLVGKIGPIAPSGYVRLPDQDAVVVVSGDLRPTVIRSLTDWRDKTIVRVDTASVVRVVLETDAGTHVAERSDSTWSVDGEPADATRMRSLLDELANFVAVGFLEDEEVSLEDEKRVTALGANGDTLGTVLLTGEAGTRHARTPGSDVVFEVPSFRADRITPDMESLRAVDPAGA